MVLGHRVTVDPSNCSNQELVVLAGVELRILKALVLQTWTAVAVPAEDLLLDLRIHPTHLPPRWQACQLRHRTGYRCHLAWVDRMAGSRMAAAEAFEPHEGIAGPPDSRLAVCSKSCSSSHRRICRWRDLDWRLTGVFETALSVVGLRSFA